MKYFFLFLVSIVIGFFFITPPFASAVEFTFFPSWETNTYIPTTYQGKRLPTNNSPVTITFSLLRDGVPVDLSRATVRWYINQELYRSGQGVTTIVFTTDRFLTKPYEIRITLPSFTSGNDLEHFFTITVVKPETVIDAPYLDNRISHGVNLLRGLLYFFNTNDVGRDIQFSWQANNTTVNARVRTPDILELAVPPETIGSTITVVLDTNHKTQEMEIASGRVLLFVEKSL